ncbi:hypothetical protein AB0M36_33595 [Actinoplanes sp. NPDC051346]|uniref:InlB B-repeat-containing protein n=1 Tax=Actinoplanes sp. NPDC051346 TaxID=3155048 RepID=UPI0034346174
MNRSVFSVALGCALGAVIAAAPVRANTPPARAAAVVPQAGAYAFGCNPNGNDCAGTFLVSGQTITALSFRPVRCVDGKVSASPSAAIANRAFSYGATVASSVSVPVTFQASGTFQTSTGGSLTLRYEAPGVECAATTSTHTFIRRDDARLGWQGWRDAGLAIDGAMDLDVVVLPDGRMRMYYGLGVGGSNTWRITSSISSDGRTWTPESTNLVGRAWGPCDVVRLPDGRFRMYYTPSDDPDLAPGQMRSTRSAISDDGINWTVEPGHRLNPAAFTELVPSGGIDYQVSHPGVVRLPDGTWLLLTAFSIARGFDPKGVSSRDHTELIVWATSSDGLTFTARGIAVDSRNKATFDGMVGSPDPVIWEDGGVRAYFWSAGPQIPNDQKRYNGIMVTTFTGTGWTTPRPVRTSATFPGAAAAALPGGDPTTAIFNGRMFMYYGQFSGGHQVSQHSVMASRSYKVQARYSGGRITAGISAGSGALRTDVSTGMRCGRGLCAATVLAGTGMWLYATPARGYRFTGWAGCNGTRPGEYPPPTPEVKPRLCWVSATKNITVTARFARRR